VLLEKELLCTDCNTSQATLFELSVESGEKATCPATGVSIELTEMPDVRGRYECPKCGSYDQRFTTECRNGGDVLLCWSCRKANLKANSSSTLSESEWICYEIPNPPPKYPPIMCPACFKMFPQKDVGKEKGKGMFECQYCFKVWKVKDL